MFKRHKEKQIAALVDDESRHTTSDASALETPELMAYRDTLLRLREGARNAAARTPEIGDGQFGAFMAGIREGIGAPAPRPTGLWAMASLSAAALLLVLSLLAIFARPNEPVKATEVESAYTELDGVAVDWYDPPEGVTTVWVTMPETDLW